MIQLVPRYHVLRNDHRPQWFIKYHSQVHVLTELQYSGDMEQVSEVTECACNHFLESCHIKKKAFYSSLGHSSIPVHAVSETSLNLH